jgi:hypothetical protein
MFTQGWTTAILLAAANVQGVLDLLRETLLILA